MKFLLDTCVIYEFVKRRPDPGLVAWLKDLLRPVLEEAAQGVHCLAVFGGDGDGRLGHVTLDVGVADIDRHPIHLAP